MFLIFYGYILKIVLFIFIGNQVGRTNYFFDKYYTFFNIEIHVLFTACLNSECIDLLCIDYTTMCVFYLFIRFYAGKPLFSVEKMVES